MLMEQKRKLTFHWETLIGYSPSSFLPVSRQRRVWSTTFPNLIEAITSVKNVSRCCSWGVVRIRSDSDVWCVSEWQHDQTMWTAELLFLSSVIVAPILNFLHYFLSDLITDSIHFLPSDAFLVIRSCVCTLAGSVLSRTHDPKQLLIVFILCVVVSSHVVKLNQPHVRAIRTFDN